MKLSRLFYISRRQKLPRLRHHLTSGRKLDTQDKEVNMLLEAGLMRDWSEAKQLIRSKKVPVEVLFWKLSKKRKADWKKRLRNWFVIFMGGYTHDPHRKEFYELTREGKEYVRNTKSRSYQVSTQGWRRG